MRSILKLSIAIAIITLVIVSSYTPETRSTDLNKIKVTQLDKVRIGYFPNVNHAQAIIGFAKGDFQRELNGVRVEGKLFNAGPSAIEALMVNDVDVLYVGPMPTISGYLASNGTLLRIVAGSASGGAVFIVRNDSSINTPNDLTNKRFAVPQIGNTQDIVLRTYLLDHGYKTIDKGGSVTIIPAKNTEMVTLFSKKEIDGAWVPEPWATKILKLTNTKLFLDERDIWPNKRFVSANIVVRTDFLKKYPDIVEKIIRVHVEETIWINNNREVSIDLLQSELERLTNTKFEKEELREAMSRLDFTYDPIKDSLIKIAENAYKLGYIDKKPDLSNIYDLNILNKVLREKGLKEVI